MYNWTFYDPSLKLIMGKIAEKLSVQLWMQIYYLSQTFFARSKVILRKHA